jgi:predicted TIM-barrel fold metal-dependent hydrolase
VPITQAIRRIDAHQHVLFDEYVAALDSKGIRGSAERPWPEWSLPRMLEQMAVHEIDAVTVSISSPGTYFGDIDFTRKLVRICNDCFAELSGLSTNRIASLGLVPLPDIEAACQEVEYALDVLKLDGLGLVSHYNDIYLGEPDFEEFYQELDKRGAVVFVHPVRPMNASYMQYSFPSGYVELVAATGRVIANLLATGVMERYPSIKWYIPHSGGIVPSILYRLLKLETMPKFQDKVPQGVRTYLKRIYYDVAQASEPETLEALMQIADPDKILFGTDYPFAIDRINVIQDTINGIETFGGFDDALRKNIYRENALALFPRFYGN